MTTVTIQEAQAKLPEIIDHLHPGEDITITDHGVPLAQVKKQNANPGPAKPAQLKTKFFGSHRILMSRLKISRSTWSEAFTRYPYTSLVLAR